MDTESRIEETRVWRRGIRTYCLIGIDFLVGMMKGFWK
jgi:hypothetical protein